MIGHPSFYQIITTFYSIFFLGGGAENAGQDIAGQDNDGQKKHHAWVEIKT